MDKLKLVQDIENKAKETIKLEGSVQAQETIAKAAGSGLGLALLVLVGSALGIMFAPDLLGLWLVLGGLSGWKLFGGLSRRDIALDEATTAKNQLTVARGELKGLHLELKGDENLSATKK